MNKNDKSNTMPNKRRTGGTYRDIMQRMEKEGRKEAHDVRKDRKPVRRERDYFGLYPTVDPMTLHTCPLTGEQMYEFIHPSGARLIYIHRDVKLSAGTASVPYGASETHVSVERGRRAISLSGCAHFAEHMLFTGKGGRLERFSAMGCEANAFTSPISTTYCFTSGTEEGTKEGFSELMKMVLNPEFDEGQTEKEREIILRELEEDDDVFYEGRRRLIGMLWSRGSVRRDPGGSAKYVRRITNEMLRGVYECAYRPSEMVFTLVSNISIGDARGIFESNLLGVRYTGKVSHTICRSILGGEKRREAFAHESESPVFFCGLAPDISGIGQSILGEPLYSKSYVYTSLLEAMIFDRSEPLFLRLSKEVPGIYGEFVSDTELRYSDCIMSANLMCEDPDAAADAFERIFSEMKESGELFAFENFESKRRILAADYLTLIESPQDAALTICDYLHRGDNLFSVIKIIMGLDKDTFITWAKGAIADRLPVYAIANGRDEEQNAPLSTEDECL